jgi:hypothetical protein
MGNKNETCPLQLSVILYVHPKETGCGEMKNEKNKVW